VSNLYTIHENYPIRLRHRVRQNPYTTTINKFSDNLKSSIFTQNHLSQFQKSLVKSNNLRTPLELLSNHISQDHKLNPISPSPKNPKIPYHIYLNQLYYFLFKCISFYFSTTTIKPLEVHNLTLPENTHLNCVKFSHNSMQQFYT